jgi:hypothetical protein
VLVEPVGELELKGIRRPLVADNVIGQFQPENEPAVDRAIGGPPIRLVHEGNARSEGGEGVAQRDCMTKPNPRANTKVANSKFENGARLRRAMPKF